ncbi:glycosyltransferase [Pseudomonas sp. SWRI107]|uniref:glycosyltransferase n=1 Tax=Pseudomonas farsensis TaxID=2745492 RepID=UPI001644BF5E|nr:glycosyltransferase [Pseudomonas farsensis]MBV4533607.1 glycosyltransferase [Pseudomonas farsensis]
MIETATGSRSDVTVILLGQESSESRVRAAHYYLGQGILGQSATHQAGAAGVSRAALEQALGQVSTALVMLALDSDFVLGEALDNAAACLQAQPHVDAAQGYALGYVPGTNHVSYHKLGAALADASQQGAQARVSQYASAGQQAWRAVVRVSALQAVVATLPNDLQGASLLVALSCKLLQAGAIARLHQTDVVCDYQPCDLAPSVREERQVQLVRALHDRQGQPAGVEADDEAFRVLNLFVRSTYEQLEAPLLVTSTWDSIVADPQRAFESRQYLELPYYTHALFEQLIAIEFLCHVWPVGQRHQHLLEGAWVRQHDLLLVHPNDTSESLQQRYWQALGLGLFNLDVCLRLLPMLSDPADLERARELRSWIERLQQVPAPGVGLRLQQTSSGKVLADIARATPGAAGNQRIQSYLAKHQTAQLAFVVLDLHDDAQALQATFDSLLACGLRNFKLVVLTTGKPPAITTARDVLHFIQVNENNWLAHLNQVVRQLSSEWLLLLDAGDTLLAGGLQRLLVELVSAPACQAIACNEVQRDAEGRLHEVVRPGADLDLLRGQPGLMSRHWLVQRQSVVDLGGYSETYRHACELDLLLRLVEERGVSSLAHMDEYLVVGRQAGHEMAKEAVLILNRHLAQLGYRGHVTDLETAGLAIDFRHSAVPLVSILLAYEGDREQLQACLTAILQRTRYPRYEILLACAGNVLDVEDPALNTFAGRVRLLVGDAEAARPALLDLAARQARGEYLVMLSQHCQVNSPAWIEALMNEGQRPEVGVVGACLHTGEGVLVHAGYQLLAGPGVQEPWKGFTVEQGIEVRWPQSVRQCAAVADACLMVRKDVFEHCGGVQASLDAGLSISLAVAHAGLMVIWTPRSLVFAQQLPTPCQDAIDQAAHAWPAAFSAPGRDDAVAQPLSSADEPAWLAQLD